MTCPMSPSKRALLPRREVAVTVGYWSAHDDVKNSRFFVGVRRGASTIHTPPTHAQAQGMLGGVVGRGGESCWGG